MAKIAKSANTALATVAQEYTAEQMMWANAWEIRVDQLPVGTTQQEAEGQAHAAIQEAIRVHLAEQGLAQVTLPKETRETAENYIVPAGPLGKERWFIKKNLHAHKKDDLGVMIIATIRQLKDRGITVN